MTRGSTTAGAVDGAAVVPWLVLGIVLGLLFAGAGAWLAVGARRPRRSTEPVPPPPVPDGWAADDLPGFLEHPPGVGPEPVRAAGPPPPPRPFADVVPAAPHAVLPVPSSGGPGPGRTLLALATVGALLVASAAAVALQAPGRPGAAGEREQAAPDGPSWDAPDLPPAPEEPGPGDPGAGLLARLSVPVGPDGAMARLAFEGVVLERRAVGVTVTYPAVSLTAAEVPGGPALAHVRLPTWNCLTDSAPADPAAAGCLRTPVEYADLPAPALEVAVDGERVRMSGRFATYVRPAGSPPEWTGRVYPLTVTATPDGEGASGTLALGVERTTTVADPTLSEVRTGG